MFLLENYGTEFLGSKYGDLSTLLIWLSFVSFLSSTRNLILTIISLELMLFGLSLNFIMLSFVYDDMYGQLFALIILTVAAAESAIGLAILVINYRLKGTISLDGYVTLSSSFMPRVVFNSYSYKVLCF